MLATMTAMMAAILASVMTAVMAMVMPAPVFVAVPVTLAPGAAVAGGVPTGGSVRMDRIGQRLPASVETVLETAGETGRSVGASPDRQVAFGARTAVCSASPVVGSSPRGDGQYDQTEQQQ